MRDNADQRPLDGLHILVAEDDFLQCDGICSSIVAAGGVVVGPAYTLPEAQQLVAANGFHIALVDIDLGDGTSFDLASKIESQGLPFIFATGLDCRNVPPAFEHIRCLEKPFTEHDLVRTLVETASSTRH
jgi:DNA-binding NtrC family response regulator